MPIWTCWHKLFYCVGGDFVVNGYASVDGDAEVNERYSWLRAGGG